MAETAFQIGAFQSNAFQMYVSTGTDIYYNGGPGGSDKAGKKRRRRVLLAPENPYQIPWGKNSDLLLDLLPQETVQEDWISDVVERYVETQADTITSINSLLLTINNAIITHEQDIAEIELRQYKQKLIANYRKAKRRQDDEEMICLLICM